MYRCFEAYEKEKSRRRAWDRCALSALALACYSYLLLYFRILRFSALAGGRLTRRRVYNCSPPETAAALRPSSLLSTSFATRIQV